MRKISRLLPIVIGIFTFAPLNATDYDGGAYFAMALPGRDNIMVTQGAFPTGTTYSASNNFQNQWGLGGISLSAQVFRRGRVGFWIGGSMCQSLGTPRFNFSTSYKAPGPLGTETSSINGQLSYSGNWVGIGLSLSVGQRGEVAFWVGPRSNSITLDGRRKYTNLLSPITEVPYSLSVSGQDLQVSVSGTTLQQQATYKTFQRLTLSTAIGGSFGIPSASPADWQMMNKAYLDRTRPNFEIRVTFGLRS